MAEDEPVVDNELQRTILLNITRLKRRKVVSTNKVLHAIRQGIPACPLSTEELVRLVREAAICLGIVPVFDPERGNHVTVRFGYGHPAHQPDPDGTYVFKPGVRRVLPVRADKRWHVTG